MQTDEIVRRLLGRPVTPERALKVLHLLEKPSQAQEVIEGLTGEVKEVVQQALTPQVVQAHFARYRR